MCNTRHMWARFTRFLSDSLYLSDPLKVVRLKQADTWFTSDYVDAPRTTVWPFLSLAVIVPTTVDSPKGSEAIKRILFSPIKGRLFKQSDSGRLQQELMMHSDYPSLWKQSVITLKDTGLQLSPHIFLHQLYIVSADVSLSCLQDVLYVFWHYFILGNS